MENKKSAKKLSGKKSDIKNMKKLITVAEI
jgi:hypothetical protein